ncbi:hypothetical protein Hamer_G031030, partial [Homarus americanus]
MSPRRFVTSTRARIVNSSDSSRTDSVRPDNKTIRRSRSCNSSPPRVTRRLRVVTASPV